VGEFRAFDEPGADGKVAPISLKNSALSFSGKY
jgi:hypothetical protein